MDVEAFTNAVIMEVNVDNTYRGHDYEGSAVIKHVKNAHRLRRCMLRGCLGNALNLMGSASGFNIRKILRRLAAEILSRVLMKMYVLEKLLGKIWHCWCSALPSKHHQYG